MARLLPIPLLALLPVLFAACQNRPAPQGKWPPADFLLEIEHSIVDAGIEQVTKRADFSADGLVVYREASDSLCSGDGQIRLPVFRRMCAYRLDWRTIRCLSRELHAAPAKGVRAPAHPPGEDRFEMIRFHLTYMGNRIDIVLRERVTGLMNRVLRIVNCYLPPEHAFSLPHMAGVALPCHVQDVPPVTDSVTGALGFHRTWLRDRPDSLPILGETFALSCAASEWRVAEACLDQMAQARPGIAESLGQILRAARARSSQRASTPRK